MQRLGRRNRPTYRIVVLDSRVKRQGEALENVGTYDPVTNGGKAEIQILVDRVKHWESKGAQCSPSVKQLVKTFQKKLAAAPAKA
jgi:small subunit ribosomal protein S16